MVKTLRELADLLGGKVLGTENPKISGITNIEDAGEGEITFAVPPHLDKAAASLAAAVIIPDTVSQFPKPAISVANPRAAFTQLLALFNPPVTVVRGIHPTAVVGNNVQMGDNVAIMAQVVISDDAKIGDNSVIYPQVYIGPGVEIATDCVIYPNVTIYDGCQIGQQVTIHSGTVIGSDGFGYITLQGTHHKVPQVGIVILESDVEVGSNVCIDRATTGATIIKKGTKIDNLVHLAHNVEVGENCFLVAFTGISGSTKIGNNVTFAGQSGSTGHVTIGENCVFAARTGVIGDVPSNSVYAGFPARPHREWLKSQAQQRKVPELLKKVQQLEQRLQEIEAKNL